MNTTLKNELKTLAMLPHDPGIAAFRALFRRRAGNRAARVEKNLRNMILMMPETLEQVRRQSTAPDVPRSAHGLYGYLLTYLYEPKDVIPERDNGLFGYVDDAYLVTAAHRRTSGRLDPQIGEWLGATDDVIPAETERLDALLDGLIGGETRPYEEALGY